MRAGRLDRLIELRHVVQTVDLESGQTVETWPAAYATVWAEKRDVRGREYFAAQQVNAEVTTTFRIYWRADVLATDRIVCEGLVYTINPPAEIGRREGLEIVASAVRT